MSEEIKRHRIALQDLKAGRIKIGRGIYETYDFSRGEDLVVALTFFITLADDYLACKGFPEEKTIYKHVHEVILRKGKLFDYKTDLAKEFNHALHLCRVAHLKIVGELKEEIAQLKSQLKGRK